MNHIRRSTRLLRLLAPAALLVTLVVGCSRLSPVEPEPLHEPAPVVADDSAENSSDLSAPPPPSRLYAPAPDSSGTDLLGEMLAPIWKIVCIKLVSADRDEEVKVNRYELFFPRGSLSSDITFTMQDYDQDVLDIQLGPHGTQFKEPVTLSIDFSDTAADPRSVIANGCEPVLWWWNEDRNRWEEVPGRTDWENRRHIVRLEHFSRYVVGGKAGWKHQPLTETD